MPARTASSTLYGKIAIMPSPRNLTISPECSWMIGLTSFRYSLTKSKFCWGDMFSERWVKPRTSENITAISALT